MPLGSACLSALPKHRFPLVAFSVRKHHLLLQQLKSCTLDRCNIRATVTHHAVRLIRNKCGANKTADRMRRRMRPNRKRQEWISFLAESDRAFQRLCPIGVVPRVANVARSLPPCACAAAPSARRLRASAHARALKPCESSFVGRVNDWLQGNTAQLSAFPRFTQVGSAEPAAALSGNPSAQCAPKVKPSLLWALQQLTLWADTAGSRRCPMALGPTASRPPHQPSQPSQSVGTVATVTT